MKLFSAGPRFLLVLIAITGLYLSVTAHAGPLEPSEVVSHAVNAFAVDLYAKLKESDKNLFFSPYSASSAFSMAYAGAKGPTADQMAKVLHYRLDRERLAEAFEALEKSMLSRLKSKSGRKGIAKLNIANALWGQRRLGFRKDYLNFLRTNYGAGLRELDFAGAPEHARRIINTWTEKQTDGRIKNFIPPGKMRRDTLLVLINAIYFKNTWEHQFSKSKTKISDFTLRDGRKISVSMMHQKERFRYMEGPGFQAVQLPYGLGWFSMVVFLPRDYDGLEEFEKSLNTENLAGWFAELGQGLMGREVNLFLPRFKVRSAFSLKEPLMSLGMTLAFSGAADFSGILRDGGAAITEAFQATFIQVDEKGTEAAAATRIHFESIPPKPVYEFRADRPFMFLIRDRMSGCILFMGRVTKP